MMTDRLVDLGVSDVEVVAPGIGWRPLEPDLAQEFGGGNAEVLLLGDASRPADFVHAINADAGPAL
jgi:hypothetical protein